MRSGLWFAGISAVVAVLVALAGGSVLAAPARAGVWSGVAVAFASQVSLFWLFFVRLFPDRRMLAHLMGMLGRFVVVAVTALVWIPRSGLPPAPTLFALVAFFFVTTLMESVFVPSQESLTRR